MNKVTNKKSFSFEEGSISIPADLQDKTLNVLTSADGRSFSISITRDVLPWGFDFEDYVATEMHKLEQHLDDLVIDSKTMFKVGNEKFPLIQFHWESPQGTLHQILMMAEKDGRVVIFNSTFPGKITSGQVELTKEIYRSYQHRQK